MPRSVFVQWAGLWLRPLWCVGMKTLKITDKDVDSSDYESDDDEDEDEEVVLSPRHTSASLATTPAPGHSMQSQTRARVAPFLSNLRDAPETARFSEAGVTGILRLLSVVAVGLHRVHTGGPALCNGPVGGDCFDRHLPPTSL